MATLISFSPSTTIKSADVNSNFTNLANGSAMSSPTIASATLTSVTLSSVSAWDGWIADTHTWTYVSATSFKVTGVDVSALFPKGTRIKCTNNSSTFYGVVISSAFSTDTTITLATNSDYSLANSSITNPTYSYEACPQGYPQWFNFSPSWAGFSATPTVVYKFNIIGNICHITMYHTGNGTSNATNLTFTLPVAALAARQGIPCGSCADNGTAQTTLAVVNLGAGSTTATAFPSPNQGGWTGSGAKSVDAYFFYEF